jgi:hypothetical protein
MRDQVWDISWKLGNAAGNGGVVSGGTIVFRPHLPQPYSFVAYQSCLTGNLTYVQHGGSLGKILQSGSFSDSYQEKIFCTDTT